MLQGENAGVMAVTPDNFVGIMPHGNKRFGSDRAYFTGFENPKGILGLAPFLLAGGTGAVVTQMIPGNDGFMSIVPGNGKVIRALPA